MHVSERLQKWRPVFREFPLPPGEGGAKRRVRARMPKHWAFLPSSGPSGHLLPKGEGLACGFPRLFWTRLTECTFCRRSAALIGCASRANLDRSDSLQPAPELQQSNHGLRDALVLDSHEHGIITATHRDTAHDALRLGVSQNPVLAMTSPNTAQLDASHRHI